jgi:hypothetical protein
VFFDFMAAEISKYRPLLLGQTRQSRRGVAAMEAPAEA